MANLRIEFDCGAGLSLRRTDQAPLRPIGSLGLAYRVILLSQPAAKLMGPFGAITLVVNVAAALERHDELKHRRHGPEREQVAAIPDRCMGNPSYPRYGTRFVIHL